MSSGSQKELEVFFNLNVEDVCRLGYIYVSVFICILIYIIFFHVRKQLELQVQNQLLYSLYRMVTVLVAPCVVCEKDFMFYVNIRWMCLSSLCCDLKNKELIEEMFRTFGKNV